MLQRAPSALPDIDFGRRAGFREMQLHDALLCLWRVYKAFIGAWLEHRCQRVLLERRDALQVAFVPVAVGAERGQFFVRSEGSERRRVVQLQRVFLASVIAAALALVVVLAQQSLSLSRSWRLFCACAL